MTIKPVLWLSVRIILNVKQKKKSHSYVIIITRNNHPVQQNMNVVSNHAIYTPPSVTNQYTSPQISNDIHTNTQKMSIDGSGDNEYTDVGIQTFQKDDNQ